MTTTLCDEKYATRSPWDKEAYAPKNRIHIANREELIAGLQNEARQTADRLRILGQRTLATGAVAAIRRSLSTGRETPTEGDLGHSHAQEDIAKNPYNEITRDPTELEFSLPSQTGERAEGMIPERHKPDANPKAKKPRRSGSETKSALDYMRLTAAQQRGFGRN